MDASMWIAKTGLDAQQKRMSVISNNLANVNTTGFKRDRAAFEDALYQNLRQPGAQVSADAQSPTGLMLGTGVRIVATEKTHSQGSLVSTSNALDVAIQGDGFFQIAQADGVAGGATQQVGQIQIARFINPAGLQAIGQNLLRETPASGPAQPGAPGLAGAGQIQQGALEASNVNVVEEMVNMIETQRAYEINSKAISAVDGMLRYLNNNM